MTSGGPCPAAERRVPLANGRALVVRPIRPDDVDALAGLYGELSEEDLYRRFFQAHVPPRPALEHMADAEARGDIALLAYLVLPDGSHRVVGEAACARLPDGDGELALTVAPSARGWMGPYLLGVLCDVAAARGIANIQADILLDNRPMLALVQRRGYATKEHSRQPSIIRVVFGTSGPVPTWPAGHRRPRVVVEVPGARWHAEGGARAAGFDVLVCPGPTAQWSRCPAVRGTRCPLAAEADVVVTTLAPSSEPGRRLLQAHRDLHGDRPVCLELSSAGPPAAVLEIEHEASDDRTNRVIASLRRLVEGQDLPAVPLSGRGPT